MPSGTLEALEVFSIVVVLLQACLSMGLVIGALLFTCAYEKHDQNDDALPHVSVIMPCYLPNEKEIIVENIELLCDSTQFTKVVLVYNTPPGFEVEEEALRKLEARHPKMKLVCAKGSRSKAENLNVAVAVIEEPMTLLLDADHRLEDVDILELRRQLHAAPDSVCTAQGSVLLRGNTCWAKLVHGLSWNFFSFLIPAMQAVFGSALFFGAGAIWRTSVLQELKFDHTMIAEDDDISMRAFAKGYTMISAPLAYITELAPAGLRAFLAQRLRWTIGFEMSANRHLCRFLCWKPQRLFLRLYSYVSYVVLLGAIAMGVWSLTLMKFFDEHYTTNVKIITISLSAGPILAMLAAIQMMLFFMPRRPSNSAFVCGSIVLVAIYGFFQLLLTVYARFRLCCGAFLWVPTERKVGEDKWLLEEARPRSLTLLEEADIPPYSSTSEEARARAAKARPIPPI